MYISKILDVMMLIIILYTSVALWPYKHTSIHWCWLAWNPGVAQIGGHGFSAGYIIAQFTVMNVRAATSHK